MGGLVIPKIPGVQVNLMNFTGEDYSELNKLYYEIHEILDKNIIKCLLVFIKTNNNAEDGALEVDYIAKMIDDARTK